MRGRWVAGAGALLGTVAVLAVLVAGQPPALDRDLHAAAVRHRSSATTALARAVTELGVGPVVYLALGLAIAFAGYRRAISRRGALLVVAVEVVSQLVRLAVNVALARPRPARADWAVSAFGYSFPSGHTAGATVGWALVALVLVPAVRSRWPWVVAVVVALAVGWSRVWLGVHWPTDVLAGWALGGAWVCSLGAAGMLSVGAHVRAGEPDPAPLTRQNDEGVDACP